MLGFSSFTLSNHVANVNKLVLAIDEKDLLYGFLLFKLLRQELLYCSIMQLTHSSRSIIILLDCFVARLRLRSTADSL
jgi:hypothetical protein